MTHTPGQGSGVSEVHPLGSGCGGGHVGALEEDLGMRLVVATWWTLPKRGVLETPDSISVVPPFCKLRLLSR